MFIQGNKCQWCAWLSVKVFFFFGFTSYMTNIVIQQSNFGRILCDKCRSLFLSMVIDICHKYVRQKNWISVTSNTSQVSILRGEKSNACTNISPETFYFLTDFTLQISILLLFILPAEFIFVFGCNADSIISWIKENNFR